MSSEPMVVADGLTKTYTVGRSRPHGYTTLREQIVGWPRRVARLRQAAAPAEVLVALQDVSFEAGAGEVVGFIGHNGAGKSTLLKLLSRITTPSAGSACVRGRVGSLLEVGTGFHPELTGRENIYLNGAILGMRRREIARQFDRIVEFADVGPQLDMPVKRYSTGQFVRLAFSVAAHLEPELLLVDEVLAVGDSSFQRRSVARMSEIARGGSTVLFVSHNMAMVQSLCGRAIVLQHGSVICDGPVESAVAAYLRTLESLDGCDLAEREDRDGRLQIWTVGCSVTGPDGGPLRTGAPARFDVELSGLLTDTTLLIQVVDELGHPVCSFDSSLPAGGDHADGGEPRFACEVDALPLVEGRYRVDLLVRGGGGRVQDDLVAARFFDVGQGLLAGRPVFRDTPGHVAVPHRWTLPTC